MSKDAETKQGLIQGVSAHILLIQQKIVDKIESSKKFVEKTKKEIQSYTADDAIVSQKLIVFTEKQVEELAQLHDSPYFSLCEIVLSNGDTQTLRFAKFSYSEEEIYSWIAPISTIRFESPGPVQYKRIDGKIVKGTLIRKDNYLIVDGKIMFFTTESDEAERELIYQEHFSSQKSGFVLPEIVERMEKAQDQVIRAAHRGPFVISGPAGSGKTTLALHRVAYLLQSPETAETYTAKTVRVFVQDEGTKTYFSALLPQLGIHHVEIQTFSEWALDVLDLKGYTIREHHIDDAAQQDTYTVMKLAALKDIQTFDGTIESYLTGAYDTSIDETFEGVLQDQLLTKTLDHIDLTLLLQAKKLKDGELLETREVLVANKKNQITRKTGRYPIEYSMIVVDEFQNYLPEQLRILRNCTNNSTKAVVYVGDMHQQIRLGTIRSWTDIGENILGERQVKLAHVYRNTKSILGYIRSLGYDIAIPDQLSDGIPVEEHGFDTQKEEEVYVSGIVAASKEKGIVGILAQNSDSLAVYKELYTDNEHVKVMTIQESQGVEFEIVIMVGIAKDTFQFDESTYEALGIYEQKNHIEKDLLYVGLTRAMHELYVVGERRLSEVYKVAN